jgi:succinate dehydrogenase / fumarate reductase flavoprotein subunit
VPESTVRDADARIRAIFGRSGGQRPWEVREELATVMYDDAGVFRNSERLERCLAKVGELRERGRGVVVDDTGDRFNTDLVSVLELESMLEMADCLVTGALARTESRGAHTRLDHPERDDERWMRHTLTWSDGGDVRLDYKPVTVTRFEPMVRSY